MIAGAIFLLNKSFGGSFSRVPAVSPGETSRSGRLARSASAALTGEEKRSVWAPGAETLVLRYEADVDAGDVTVTVKETKALGREVWTARLSSSGQSQVSIPLSSPLTFEVAVRMKDFKGRYNVFWELR